MPPLDQPFTSFADIISGLTGLLAGFRAANDEKGIFCTAYLAMTQTLEAAVENSAASGLFQDPGWVSRYAVGFANLYRMALLESTTGQAPPAWAIAFRETGNRSSLVFQDLLLGMNAHINRDLPFALQAVGIEPLESRHADHTAINVVLNQAFEPVETSVTSAYAAGLGILGNLFKPFDESLTGFSFETAREAAWANAVALVSAPPSTMAAVQDNIERSASVLARLILAPTDDIPGLLPMLRHIEQAKNWWEFF